MKRDIPLLSFFKVLNRSEAVTSRNTVCSTCKTRQSYI